ncbi:MAG: carbon starvation CstA family protein [Armatimonadota bacterium]
MNAGLLLLVAVPLFWAGYRFYARYIGKVFSENPANITPACELHDGVDYVPTKPIVLFGHHFASIAGAGPIIGPTLALIFGFIPVWLWVVIGSIFVGAVHDFSALFTSMREKGKSMAEVAGENLGRTGFLLFIGFTIVMILMVTSVFLQLSAAALTSLVPLAALHMPESQTLLSTTMVDGVVKARIGGIASTSVIVITAFAPLLGYLLYRKKANAYLMSLVAVLVCAASVAVGIRHPVSIDQTTWMIVLSVYAIFAAGIPVWVVLQPRDFTNSFLLYGGVAALALAGVGALVKGVPVTAPAWNVAGGTAKLGLIWPFLFITVACGACSGFHALVAGGTTSKQCASETHARKIAYGGMVLEALLAIGVLIAVGAGLSFSQHKEFVFPTGANPSNPGAAFAVGMGSLLHKVFTFPAAYGTIFGMLLVEGFLVTTLDTAVRLNRYLFEELWQSLFRVPPRIMRTYAFNSLLSVGLMFGLAYYKTGLALWPVFGSANQLLAALTLIAVAVWLVKRKRPFAFALLPAAFMVVTAIYALWYLLVKQYMPKHDTVLAVASVMLIALAGLVVLLSARALFGRKKKVASGELFEAADG